MTDTLPSDWIDRVRTAERSGDFLVSYDIATQGLAEHPDSVDLRYLATRVLARSGATDQAAALYKRFELERERKLDFAMLGARIAKDGALICGDAERAPQALLQAARYLSGNFDAAASTRKQLRLVCRATRTSLDILDLLRPPAVQHYYGPALAGHASRHLPDRTRERDHVKK